MQPLKRSATTLSEIVFGASGDTVLRELEKKKAENLEGLDDYTKQEKDLDRELKTWAPLQAEAAKNKPLFTALFWGAVAGTITLTAAAAFVCMPAVSLTAIGGTVASCFAFKKKEHYDDMSFHSGQIVKLNKLGKDLIESGRKATKDQLKQIDDKIIAHQMKKAEDLDAKQSGAPEADIDIDDEMLVIDGIKLPKRAMQYMSPDLQNYVRGM
jgi:hypothetical protein